jgi:hypothetical protein
MRAVENIVGVAGAARPAQKGKQGGLAPKAGARGFKKIDIRFLKAHDLLEALVEKDLATYNKPVSEKALQMVRYAIGLEYSIDTEDKDVEVALRIIHNIVLDLREIAQHSVEFTRRIIEQFRWAGVLVEVDE